MRGEREFQKELSQKQYAYRKPSLEEEEYSTVMRVTDPSAMGFCERKSDINDRICPGRR